jgi:predicted permease
MNTLWQDIRYGLRGLWRQPAFTVVAVCSLALGIGANTAIFSLVNAVLLRPLPLREPERLVMVWENQTLINAPRDNVTPANYVDWREQNQVFEEMAALGWQSVNLTGDGEPEKLTSYGVTANFFPLIGAEPALGRNFLPEEDRDGGPRVVILSHGLWQRRYGGDPAVLGRDILLNGEKHTVVGVMPRGFQFLQSYVGMWTPAAFSRELLSRRNSNMLTVVARLKPGVTPERAQADIGAITERIANDHPDTSQGLEAQVVPLHEQLAGQSRNPLLVLLGAVAFVLLIACANIANLLLARAAGRRKEIAVRTALGASRGRVVRQLLTESVLLAGLGGAAGLLLAVWSFEFLKKLVPDGLAFSAGLKIDLTVAAFAVVASLLTGVLFGLAPALQASRVDLNEALKQGGGRGGLGAAGGRLRGAFVVTEVALALVLLVGAGLLVQTLFNLRGQYSLAEPEKILTVRTVLPPTKYREQPKRAIFYERVLERVRALPGVVSAGYTTSVPLAWKGGANGFEAEGPPPPQGVARNALHRQVSSDYLQTMGIALRDGRYIDERDTEQSERVLVVNETMARQHWQGESALGKRIRFSENNENGPWYTIVGVVADVRQMGLDAPVKAEMYIPHRQIASFNGYKPRDLAIRTTGDPAGLVAAVGREVHAIDPDQPVSNVATMEDVLGAETGNRRVVMTLLAAFAGVALLLAALGIYGVLAYFVAQHTPEIGVRMALGASARDILGLVLRKGMRLAALGVVFGLAASFALNRLVASLLYGVSATDPATFVGVALGLGAVALLACYLPARRAAKVDPMVALRYE